MLKEKKEQTYASTTVNAHEDNILSLSTIANTLQDVNSETPRRLVDQLLMAQKKKRYLVTEEIARKETYTFSQISHSQHSILSRPSNDKLNTLLCVPSTISVKSNDESYSDLNIQEMDKKEAMKVNVSHSTIDTSLKEKGETETQFNSNSTFCVY